MKTGWLLVLSFIATGCAVGPNYKKPPLKVPDEARGQAGPIEAASLADRPWWEIFRDETLQDLIDEALGSGYDPQVAAARVAVARANAGIARSAFFPQIQYQGQWTRGRASESLVPGGSTVSLNSVNLGLSWELDVWGRIRRANQAALAQYLSTEEARRGVVLSLVAEVAARYFHLRALDEQLAIAERTRVAFQDTYDLFQRRFEGGEASALETSSAEALLADVAARIPQLRSQIVDEENAICLLLGRNPGPIPRGETLTDQALPLEIPSGIPSDLLQRRPDLAESEQRLVAANAEVGVATANFFPAITLTGAFGGVSPDVSNLFHAGKMWSIGSALVGPLLQGGRLRNQYDARVAEWDQARLQYEQAVTSAFGEVSSLLVAHQEFAAAETEAARAVAAYRDAVRLANERYLGGLASYLDVLQAQQQLYPAENRLVQTRFDELTTLAQLYKALGGGWSLQNWERRNQVGVERDTPSLLEGMMDTIGNPDTSLGHLALKKN